jgi:hypothetical protein
MARSLAFGDPGGEDKALGLNGLLAFVEEEMAVRRANREIGVPGSRIQEARTTR